MAKKVKSGKPKAVQPGVTRPTVAAKLPSSEGSPLGGGLRAIPELPTGVYEIARKPPGNEPIEVVAYVASIEGPTPVEKWWVQEGRSVGLGDALLPDIPTDNVFTVRRVPGALGGPPANLPPGFVVGRHMWLSIATLETSFMMMPPDTVGMAVDRAFAVQRPDTSVADILIFAGDGTEMVVTRGGNAYPPRPPFEMVPLADATLATLTDVSQIHFASPQLFVFDPRRPNPDVQ